MSCRYIAVLMTAILMTSCGKKTEIRIERYPNGNLKTEIPYINDSVKHGVAKKYYIDGTLSAEANIVNGKRTGLSKYYFPNGYLEAEVNYFEDMVEGESR